MISPSARAARFFLNTRLLCRRTSTAHGLIATASTAERQAPSPHPQTPLAAKELRFHQQLTAHQKSFDAHRIQQLWKQVLAAYPPQPQQTPTPSPSARSGEVPQSPQDQTGPPVSLCNRFLQSLMYLRRPPAAISVWNDMMRYKVKPDVHSWQALLEGCRFARDATSLEDIWQRAIAAKARLDIYSWTTRIHGLIVSGREEAGIAAFDEMTRRWLDAVLWTYPAPAESSRQLPSPDQLSKIDDIGSVIKPTTSTVNACIGALLRRGKGVLASRILHLAATMGIPSNLVTYNTLLQHDIRHNSGQNAISLLADMQAYSIVPDIITFTILLDGLWRNHPPPSADEATAQTTQLLDRFASLGLDPTPTTYSMLLINLLAPPYSNLPLARAVLAHMEMRNLPPGPHIPTILITHMFRSPPPGEQVDVEGIRAYTERLFLDPDRTRALDALFYERLVRGWANLAETRSMMAALHRWMRSNHLQGRPRWTILQDVILALTRRGDGESHDRTSRQAAIREIIDGVQTGGWAEAEPGQGGRAETEFWSLVEDIESNRLRVC